MSSTRREFLAGTLAAGVAAPLTGARLAPSWLQMAGGRDDPILVVVQARGGYDLFNMLVPADDPVYYTARPTIGVPKAQTLGEVQAGSRIYWHPVMAPFKVLYDLGELALIQNIGYPSPNLSHFQSEKKWYAGDPTVTLATAGWLARYLQNYTGTDQLPAMNLENRRNPSFAPARVPVLTSASAFAYRFDRGSAGDNQLEALAMRVNSMWLRPAAHPNLQYVVDSSLAAMDDSVLLQNIGLNYQPMATYPNISVGRTLQLAARYITGGLDTHL